MKSRLGLVAIAIATVLTPVHADQASPTGPVGADHAQLQRWETGAAVPVSGVSWSHDTASWTLESGRVRFLRPLSDGTVTGFVFEGRGRFEMSIPDPFEVAQLQRFSGEPAITAIEEPFSQLVYRSSGSLPEGLEPPTAEGAFKPDDLAVKRHLAILNNARLDVDARIIAAVLNSVDDYVCADIDTDSFGWLMYEFDPWRHEEIQLSKFQKLNDYVEDWVSLDRREHRDADGRPTGTPQAVIDIDHIDFIIDLSKHKASTVRGESEPEWAEFKVRVELTAVEDGLRALPLGLHSRARLHAVRTTDGVELEFLRDRIGKRFSEIRGKVYDFDTVVVLDRPMAAGESLSLEFVYEIEIHNYVSGRGWYPGQPGTTATDLHTATLTFRMPKKFEVRSLGEEIETASGAGGVTSAWRVSKPTKMVGFSIGKGFKEERLKVEGVPEVVAFGDPDSAFSGGMVRNVAADVVNSLNFFQWYFNVEIPADQIYATAITGSHGQAFEGFLHLSSYTFEDEHPGASELFRAHEAAHQLWGHMIRWGSYRDQWLSESFAEYSAMLFVEATMAKQGFFEDILKVYTQEQLGSMKASMSKFARPWDVSAVRTEGEHLGPIGAGYRASSCRLPSGYLIQAYRKGPLVLHMIRSLLQGMSEDYDLFRAVMQEFVHTYKGEVATTDDFKELLEKRTDMDWTDFFDAWIYGCDIPTYQWDYSIGKDDDGGPVVVLNVTRSNVPEDFNVHVPVRCVFGKGEAGQVFVLVDEDEKTFTIPLPANPSKVVFNPDHAVLARVKN